MSIFEYDEEKVKALWKRESFEDGLEQGRKEGKAEGRAEGKAEGKEEGRAEGECKGIELAKTVFKLTAQNLSPEEIAERLNISTEKVLEILE